MFSQNKKALLLLTLRSSFFPSKGKLGDGNIKLVKKRIHIINCPNASQMLTDVELNFDGLLLQI